MMKSSFENRERKTFEDHDLDSRAVQKTIGRILRYSAVRIFSILATVGLGLYLTLMILNMGGFVDEIMEGQIAESLGGMALSGAFEDIPSDQRDVYIENLRLQMEESIGLHEPLALRTARWWFNGVTLQWGNSDFLTSMDRQSRKVSDVVFSRLPYTLLLVGAANVVLFFVSLWTAMGLSSHQGKFWDRVLSALTPISSAPSWVIGVVLLAVFALELRILPFKGMFDGAPPENPIQYGLQILKHMVLPVAAIILSVFFKGVYTWRTFFLVHSGEDYVELAKAKGLPESVIRKKYLLRPTLPSVITSFAMMIITFWEGAIALELLFQWPGLGAIFFRAIYSFDRAVVVAIVVMFAYLLGISVLVLDIIYAIIDPRVRVGGNGLKMYAKSMRIRKIFDRTKRWLSQFSKSPGKLFADQKVTAGMVNGTGMDGKRLNGDFENSNSAQSKTQPVHLKMQDDETTKPIRIILQNSREISQKETAQNDDVARPVIVPKQSVSFLKSTFHPIGKRLIKKPMAAVGLLVIIFLIVVAIWTVIAIPYDEAVAYWHSEGTYQSPRFARPVWTNLFRREKWPESIYFDSTKATEGVSSFIEEVAFSDKMVDVRMSFEFDYWADDFPQDLVVYFSSTYKEKAPFASIMMIAPDGREMEIKSLKATNGLGFFLSYEDKGYTQIKGPSAIQKVFGDPDTDFEKPLKGRYTLQVLTIVFEEDSNVEISGVMHGTVFGLFGTDSLRRDLTIAMLWGTPVALTFGIVGALLTTTTTILLAAVSSWYGGWVDEILQRITEINIILPSLPIAVLIFFLYSKNIWVILSIMILLNIFGNSLKEYRAMFMQFKESPYIDAARAYGATDGRIIMNYMLPRIVQVVVPQLVISVPSFVFLEATLAYLGVSSPFLPTWGKVINMALTQGTFWGYYYWVLQPIVLVLITGLAFAFVGFALDEILNPRLRNR